MMQHSGYDMINKITSEINQFERAADDHHNKLAIHKAQEIG